MERITHQVLCVDDEKPVRSALKRLLRKERYKLFTASSGEEGLEIMGTYDIHLVISDQRMPEMSGITFLTQVKKEYPDTIRILLTGYTQIDFIKESVNKGNIYKFILKPWNDDNLKNEIRKSLEQYDLIKKNRALSAALEKKNQELQEINANLETIVSRRTRVLKLQNQTLELIRSIFENLPLATVGISPEFNIILINRDAKKIKFNNRSLGIGESIKDYLPEKITREISRVLDHGDKTVRLKENIGGSFFELTVSTLPGRFSKSGIILCFHTQET